MGYFNSRLIAGTLKEKKGYRLKPENLRFWTIHKRHLYDVRVSRNRYKSKTVSKLYQNVYISDFVYELYSIKQTIFNNYATNLKTTISHRSLRISDLLQLLFFNFYFAFLIGTIDDIITYSLYIPYYVTRTSANSSLVSLWHVSHDQYTALLLVEDLVT